MSYDTQCHELACHFLQDEKISKRLRNAASHDLAQQIQDLVESFMEYDLVEMAKAEDQDASDRAWGI